MANEVCKLEENIEIFSHYIKEEYEHYLDQKELIDKTDINTRAINLKEVVDADKVKHYKICVENNIKMDLSASKLYHNTINDKIKTEENIIIDERLSDEITLKQEYEHIDFEDNKVYIYETIIKNEPVKSSGINDNEIGLSTEICNGLNDIGVKDEISIASNNKHLCK